MITVNTYNIAERAVYSGIALGVQNALKDLSSFQKPEALIDSLVASVMDELVDTFDFGTQPVRFTPDMMRKLWVVSEEQDKQEKPV